MFIRQHHPRLGVLFFCFFLLSACGTKHVAPSAKIHLTSWMNTPEDVRRFPQDLNVYANIAGRDKFLMNVAEQTALDARFNQIFFGPWDMSATSVRRKDATAIFRKASGYKLGGVPWQQVEWEKMGRNALMENFPARHEHAVTLRNTDLREMPTHEPRFTKPTPDPRADPFDMFQYSLLPPGTPLFIAHTTLDGRWHYVECPIAGGWVDALDVALVDADFERVYRTGSYVALVRDNVRLADAFAGVGAVFPAIGGKNAANGRNIMFPVKGLDGMARISEIALGPADAALKPILFTAGNVARIGNVMMAQQYGWGGMFGNRDCSALTRDIMMPFGIWLPRNSLAQARRGVVHHLDSMSPDVKESFILGNGVPFASLVGMRGHIMLYVGKYKGHAAVFHNVWGIRVVDGVNSNARLVIGRSVVTSLTPGKELKNMYLSTTFADRVRTLTNLADKHF
ncbi:MAG: SH3 domain-containing protein [Desulfovibrio sp.]|jgi:hypothetical protein|nr:SH3 domain-containing protein [Desulfovibrio sp.]